jgi:hypothetical protein
MSEHRLGEILIERPRGGLRMSSRRLKGARRNLDQLTREMAEGEGFSSHLIKVRNRTKYLSENLTPLRRFLQSKVGQNWDETYRDLCAQIDPSTMVGQHVLQHLWQFVERHVEMVDDRPIRKLYYARMGGPLYSNYWTQYYIHPESQLLLMAPTEPQEITSSTAPVVIVVDDNHHYRSLDGIWYLLTFAPFHGAESPWDLLLKQRLSPILACNHYGERIYVCDKRQCNKRQIRDIEQRLAAIEAAPKNQPKRKYK